MNIKLRNDVLMALSEMIDVMGIKNELSVIETKSNEELGQKLIIMFITNLYKAKKQYYDLVIKFKQVVIKEENLSVEEKYNKQIQKVEQMDAIEIFKELIQIEGISNFLAS